MKTIKNNTLIKIWLYTIMAMVFSMVFIGGVTRLTNSGLSMVEWKPLLGAIPPLSEDQWLETFHKYQQFPQYKLVNHQMNLSEFKNIFFWEYFHRLFGRLIGLVFFIPFMFFIIKKKLNKSMIKKFSVAFFLGGMQGLMGWYMVQSGLVDRPDVSHLRLAAHLLLAFIIMGYIYWLILELNFPKRIFPLDVPPLKIFMLVFLVVLFLQFIYGAFVAGLDAGLTHNTFPKMGHHWIPADVYAATFTDIIDHKVVVQFVHRAIGFVLLILVCILLYLRRTIKDLRLKNSALLLSVMIFVQFILGIIALLSNVKISFASLHQLGAGLVLLFLVRTLYFTYKTSTQSRSSGF